MSQKLNNKVAVITGGSSGIGLAIAKRFAQEGAKVAITGRNQKTIDQAIAEIGPNGLGIQGDVSKLGDLTRIYETVADHLGKVDILIVNAGVYVLAPLADFTEEQFDQVSDINFKGAFFSVQKALPVRAFLTTRLIQQPRLPSVHWRGVFLPNCLIAKSVSTP